jgi:diadenosine tetraphosphate (Ap4A) HIT family hydrolase
VVETCPFCRPDDPLWEGQHYLVLADAYPRCAGHVLLVTREHLSSHMDAPPKWLEEFARAQDLVRAFLLATFGRAAFYENGGARQQVPHAHLHGLPFHPRVKRKWLKGGKLEAVAGWPEARREKEEAGRYFYLETADGSFLIREYAFVLKRVRDQLFDQTEASVDPETGKMRRGGPEMVRRTREMWIDWRGRNGA